MLLRPRQKVFAERCISALSKYGNTLALAPTGSGKTVIFCSVISEILKLHSHFKCCVLQHREELVQQNRMKFGLIDPDITTSLFTAKDKSWEGRVTFAMVQSLSKNLAAIPALDLLVVDEAHHCAATTYVQIIERVLSQNPKALIFGVTATPCRADGKLLRQEFPSFGSDNGPYIIFNNIADQIFLHELIISGHLVKPRIFVIDIGIATALLKLRKEDAELNMARAESIMNTRISNQVAVKNWKLHAFGRKTIVFATTITHAISIRKEFTNEGISAEVVHSNMSRTEREDAIASFKTGKTIVLVNAAVLIEGFDHPPTSCIVLLRPTLYKSTLIQMIGRGLRPVHADEFPGVQKTDCVVLDFGTACVMHGNLEMLFELDADNLHEAKAEDSNECPACNVIVPTRCRECPTCGHTFKSANAKLSGRVDPAATLDECRTHEINVIGATAADWCDLFADGSVLMICRNAVWVGVFPYRGRLFAVGGFQAKAHPPPRVLFHGSDQGQCCRKAEEWLADIGYTESHQPQREAPTPEQWNKLGRILSWRGKAFVPGACKGEMTRHRASVLITLQDHKRDIELAIGRAILRDLLAPRGSASPKGDPVSRSVQAT